VHSLGTRNAAVAIDVRDGEPCGVIHGVASSNAYTRAAGERYR
jgi:hypothetical protein